MRRSALPSALVSIVLAAGGCGGDDRGVGGGAEGRPAEGGTLEIALAGDPSQLDPLFAAGRSSQVVTRQIHEPLVAAVTGPFGDVREVPGLAQSSSSSSDAAIWRFRLRPRVQFGDGTPFNASAVLANADRWLASTTGRALLPGLTAVDAPRPDLVRFILDRSDPGFPVRLAQARLGLVTPRALRGVGPGIVARVLDGGTGTGAYEFRERETDGATVLARNLDWWGSRLGLGPALDQLSFSVMPDTDQRVARLADGEEQLVDELGPAAAREVQADPLLTVEQGRGGPQIGVERSLRGIEFAASVPVLSGVWRTTVGAGE